MISVVSWVGLAMFVCLSANQFLGYQSDILHTSFSLQQAAHLSATFLFDKIKIIFTEFDINLCMQNCLFHKIFSRILAWIIV